MKFFTFSITAAFVLALFAAPAFAQQGTGQPGMTGQQEQQRQQQPGMTGQQEQQRQQQQPGQERQQQQREAVGQQQQPGQQQQAGQQISPQQLNSEQIRELQQSLQAQGVSPGPIDGIMGPMTERAIREFQQEEGIAATGQLDQQTLEALDLDVEEFMGVAPAFEDQQQQQQRQPQQQQQQPRQQQQQNGIDERMQDRQQQN